MIKLGTIVTDKVTNKTGMLTIFNIDMDHNTLYLFQPCGINSKTKKPLSTAWLNKARILDGIEIEDNIPLNILGTTVTDKATGFTGIVTAIDKHINGCFHADIRSSEVIEETGESVDIINLDIRRLMGDEIPNLDDESLEKDRIENPSPEFKPSMFRK